MVTCGMEQNSQPLESKLLQSTTQSKARRTLRPFTNSKHSSQCHESISRQQEPLNGWRKSDLIMGRLSFVVWQRYHASRPFTGVNPNAVDNPSLTVEFRRIRAIGRNIARTLGEEWRGGYEGL